MRNWKFRVEDFINLPLYQGHDLGISWTKEQTEVRIWAPTAQRVFFRIYANGVGGEPISEYPMHADIHGTWTYVIEGDLDGKYYTIQVRDNQGWLNEIPDIYAKATGANGHRGMICDLAQTNPELWASDVRRTKAIPTDMVIYEVHVRDFSMSYASGIKNRGKYLGFTERGTKLSTGESTGVDHLKELGITHVHLLPVADFYTVDELNTNAQYNWGYDPLNYNTPEGWYSTNSNDGRVRIKEFKEMVLSLHSMEIGVILDVVYNHTGLIFESYFNQTIPGYFYRLNEKGDFSDASGCGTELATEREMVRKYIIDSVVYWAEEYHIDGFRFDLMGLMDIETMNQIRRRLDTIDTNIFMYGEGWSAAESPLPAKYRAVKENTLKLDRIASFCDDLRDGLKGSAFDKNSGGFINGVTLKEEQIKFGIIGAIEHDQIIYDYVGTSKKGWANSPCQCINYVSCHDNYTLFDKLQYSSPEALPEKIERMARLALGIVLTSQGVPFLFAGDEMLRSKGGHPDSYRSPDEINKLDWPRKHQFDGIVNFTKMCIELRRRHPAFRMAEDEMVRAKLRFFGKYIPGVISYELCDHANGDRWRRILVLLNGNNFSVELNIPMENWLIVAQNGEVMPNGAGYTKTDKVRLHPIAMMILAVDID